MALQLGATREAFLAAGASEEKASAAAEELAGYENRLAKLTIDLSTVKWMVGANLTLSLGILGRLLFIH